MNVLKMEEKYQYSTKILFESAEQFDRLVDSSFWDDKHAQPNSSDGAFEYPVYSQQSETTSNHLNSDHTFFDAGCLTSCEQLNVTNQETHLLSMLMSPLYEAVLACPNFEDVKDSDEFWKNVMINVDQSTIEEKYSAEYCNIINENLSATLQDATYSSQKELFKTFSSVDFEEAKNDLNDTSEGIAVDGCQYLENSTKETNDSTRDQPSSSSACIVKTMLKRKSRAKTFPSSTLGMSGNSSKELNLLQKLSTFSTSPAVSSGHPLQTQNSKVFTIFSPTGIKIKKVYRDEISKKKHRKSLGTKHRNLFASSNDSLSSAEKNKINGRKNVKIKSKRSACLKSSSDGSLFASKYNLQEIYNCPPKCQMDDPNTNTSAHHLPDNKKEKIFFDLKVQLGLPIEQNSTTTSGLERSPKKHSLISCIKVNKKGLMLSLPNNELNRLMVRDLLQMSGLTKERSLQEQTVDYRANLTALLKQKQLRYSKKF